MSRAWLVDVLEAALPELVGERRDELAEAIFGALPGRLLADTIAYSAGKVLKERAIADAGGDLAREIGRNCGASVLLMLQLDPEADTEVVEPALPEASSTR